MGLFGKAVNQGSAFARVAQHEAQQDIVRGRIAAIDAANKQRTAAIALFHKEADRVHADADQIDADFAALLARL